MRKTHMKLGLLIAMTCLFVAAGSGAASAHTVQASKKFRPWFAQRPHITVKILSNKGLHTKNSDVERAVISGAGFNSCGGGCGNGASDSTDCSSIGCSINTTTTSTTTTNSTTTVNSNNAPGTTCPSDCGSNSAPTAPSSLPGYSTSTTCPSDCGDNSAPTAPSNLPGYSTSTTCPSDCGDNSAPTAPSNLPGYSTSTTCPSDCGNRAPTAPSNLPGYSTSYNNSPSYSGSASYSDCGCNNTANLQSSASLSAYTPGINLSQVPVNAFGEFQIVVNVHHAHHRHYSAPAIWAVNSYNEQPSNDAPVCFCGE